MTGKPKVGLTRYEDVENLSPEDLRRAEDQAKGGLFQRSEKKVARFKIEVMFGKNRTTNGPNTYAIRVFESGKKLHGGGDVQMPFCSEVDEGHPSIGHVPPRAKRVRAGCGMPIPSDNIRQATIQARDGSGVSQIEAAHCPNCHGIIPLVYLATEIFAKTTTDVLAEELARIWNLLKGDADLYLKFSPDDIRYQALERKYGGKRARELRGLHIYPLARILKDTGAGASLVDRFKAFLKS